MDEVRGPSAATTKVMRLRYPGTCIDCGAALPAGTTAVWNRTTKTASCLSCAGDERSATPESGPPAAEPPHDAVEPVRAGTAGASARREFERRHAKRDASVREAHPHLGGLILALSDDPQSTRAWSSGARGEEILGRSLDGLAESGIRMLHDRRIPGTRANIDHVAVSHSGVHVIDAKRYVDKRPSLRVEGGFLRPRVERLMVGSSDRTKLVDGVERQLSLVREALERAGLGDAPSRGVLCFVDGDWPLIGGQFTVRGVAVRWPKALRAEITAAGTLDDVRIDVVHRTLAAAFPAA